MLYKYLKQSGFLYFSINYEDFLFCNFASHSHTMRVKPTSPSACASVLLKGYIYYYSYHTAIHDPYANSRPPSSINNTRTVLSNPGFLYPDPLPNLTRLPALQVRLLKRDGLFPDLPRFFKGGTSPCSRTRSVQYIQYTIFLCPYPADFVTLSDKSDKSEAWVGVSRFKKGK